MKALRELQQLAESTGTMTIVKYLKAKEIRQSMKGLKNPATADRYMRKITARHIEHAVVPKVICITGKAGAGKSTVAQWLAKELQASGYKASVSSFASPIKEIATTMGWNGAKDVKGRRLLQLLGTECGRNCISQTVWTDMWAARILADCPKVIIIDDCRFDSEYDAAKKLARLIGGTFHHINLVGRSVEVAKNLWQRLTGSFKDKHASEAGITYTAKLVINTRTCHISQTADILEEILK